jgi:hypothetical protein
VCAQSGEACLVLRAGPAEADRSVVQIDGLPSGRYTVWLHSGLLVDPAGGAQAGIGAALPACASVAACRAAPAPEEPVRVAAACANADWAAAGCAAGACVAATFEVGPGQPGMSVAVPVH